MASDERDPVERVEKLLDEIQHHGLIYPMERERQEALSIVRDLERERDEAMALLREVSEDYEIDTPWCNPNGPDELQCKGCGAFQRGKGNLIGDPPWRAIEPMEHEDDCVRVRLAALLDREGSGG